MAATSPLRVSCGPFAIAFILAAIGLSTAGALYSYHNVTDSMPRGWYWPSYRSQARVGDIVLACLPPAAATFARRHRFALQPGRCAGATAPILKHVIATSPSAFRVTDAGIVVDGALVPNSRPVGPAPDGAPLPRPTPGRLSGDEVLMWSPVARSFDSRYWGATTPFATASLVIKESMVEPLRCLAQREPAADRHEVHLGRQLCPSPDLQRCGNVRMASPATPDAAKAPSLAILRRDMPAIVTSLRRKARVDFNDLPSSVCCFLDNEATQHSKTGIQQAPIQTRLSAHIAPRQLTRAPRRTGHTAQIEFLEYERVRRMNEPNRDFVQRVFSRVRYTLVRPSKAQHRASPFLIIPVDDATFKIAFRYGLQFSREPRHGSRSALGDCPIAYQFGFAGCSQHMDAAINTQHLTSGRCRRDIPLALEHQPPTFVLAHDEDAPVRRNLTTLSKPQISDAGNPRFALFAVQSNRVMAMWEFELIPTGGCPETWVARHLATLDAAKEGLVSEIQPMQYRVFALAVHTGKARLLRSQSRNFSVLLLMGERYTMRRPHVFPLIQQRIVKMPGNVQHVIEPRRLTGGRIEPDPVHPPHATILPNASAKGLAQPRVGGSCIMRVRSLT